MSTSATTRQIGSVVIIDVAARYGITADGVTDNVTALMAMRTALAGNSKTRYILVFPSGTVLYSNNRWLYNIVNYEIWGGADGTVFRNIYSGADEKFQRPFFNGDIWQNNTLAYAGSQTFTNSHLFNTVATSERTITCTTIADAANYVAGNRILLWGYDVVAANYPPGTLYNEWHEVESVNGGTGVITLIKALENNWNSSWWDVPNIIDTGKNSGKPRITLLDRADYIYPRYCGFKNVTFGAPSTGAAHASGTCQIIGDVVDMENVVIEGHFWPTETRYFHGKNIRHIGDPAYFGCEFDKVSGTIYIEDSYFRSNVSQAGGFDRVILERCKFDEATLLSPRNLEIRNSTLRGNSTPSINTVMLTYGPAFQNIRRAVIENLTFIKSAANASDSAVNMFSPQSLTIAAIAGNTILVPIVTNFRDTDAQKVYTMEGGFTRIFKTLGGKKGRVTGITFDPTYGATLKTGTVTTTAGSPNVTGSSTLFTSQFAVGNIIISGSNYLGIVKSITNNTSLVLGDNTASVVTGAAVSLALGAFVIAGTWGLEVTRTGTITSLTSSPTVVGVGTSFTTELQIGQEIKSGGTVLGIITAIGSTTSLTLGANAAAAVTTAAFTQSNAPVVGEVWNWYSTSELIDLGGHSNVANIYPLFGGTGLMRSAGVSIAGKIRTVRLKVNNFTLSGDTDVAVALGGKLIDAEIIVSKQDTSTDANRTLYVLDGDRSNSDIFTINLKRSGRRFANEYTTNGSQSGDTLTSTKFGLWIGTLRFQFRNVFANPTDISEGGLPEFELVLRWME